MKKIILILAAFMIIGTIQAQLKHTNPAIYKKNQVAKDSLNKHQKLNYHLELGSQFGTYGNGSFFSTYAAPSVSSQLTDRMNITAGFIFMNSRINNTPSITGEGQAVTQNNNFNTGYFYANADYMVNERLRVSGAILYGMNNLSLSSNKRSAFQDNVSAFSFGAEYKVFEGFRIGIEIRHSQGMNPYMNSYSNPYINQSSNFMNNNFLGY